MASSLSNLVDNLAERIHKIKCKGINFLLEYESVNYNLIKLIKCFSCNENYSKNTYLRIHLSFLITILINLFCC